MSHEDGAGPVMLAPTCLADGHFVLGLGNGHGNAAFLDGSFTLECTRHNPTPSQFLQRQDTLRPF
jgi:hypothetical protein